MEEPADPTTTAAEYHHDDGSVEIVFATEDGRVLTVREYPTEEAFDDATEGATYAGEHEGVADLPGVEAFRNGDEP
jgi:hypothetical protein